MTRARVETGQRAEALAAAWLQRQGYALVARNVRTQLGEIDLIMRHGRTLVFVEVRARRTARFGAPEESITAVKLQRMLRAAQWYLTQQRWREEVPVRLDVIAIRWAPDGEPQFHHLQNVTGY